MILPCNYFTALLSDSTLDMSVILFGSPFVFTLPGSRYSLLILVFLGSFVNWDAESFLLL